ncbi:hypothetical protein [Streptomyces sp. H39-S7]|uniref:hypothetical protein n=1 Tax=Streptomyces sp. H39-S7 TaxID=3004357 RepID=UPI0022B076D6|nr:hypothetical protein [Streptomyces sp. H39-S7]MCZ4126066.1 hypothetical protein [Streptomyces sp. H39-S7]
MNESRVRQVRAVHSGATQEISADEPEITLPGGIPITVQDLGAPGGGLTPHPRAMGRRRAGAGR